jgi:hypothetical protein
MNLLLKISLLLFLLSQDRNSTSESNDNLRLWIDCGLSGNLSYEVFDMAITGMNSLPGNIKKDIITIIDFSKPSNETRLFVVDLYSKKILFNCFVAHGRNSGENVAHSFSNIRGSLKSSLGFYITGETYKGTNGYSLRLNGLEKGINDNARDREIVIHGAEYVSDDFIKRNGRLGRSWGCPAIPAQISKSLIDTISGGSCLFIFANDTEYFKNTSILRLIPHDMQEVH